MSVSMPVLDTRRLRIRPFDDSDLEAVDELMSRAWNKTPSNETLRERRRWLSWSIESGIQLAKLDQPPYGDRAVCLKHSGEVVGVAGLVPSLGPFGQLEGFPTASGLHRWQPEVGLLLGHRAEHQGFGHATEAGQALAGVRVRHLNLGRIVATTEHDNGASIAVMRKLGMTILRNTRPDPTWFQVVGVLEAKPFSW